MQASPYLVVEGVVVAFRTVTIPARDPEPFTDKRTGEQRMTRARAEASYNEVGVNAPAVVDGTVNPDVRSVLSIRWPEGVAAPESGSVVRLAVVVEQMKVYMAGRFREWLVYHYVGPAPEFVVAAPLTSVPPASPRERVSA